MTPTPPPSHLCSPRRPLPLRRPGSRGSVLIVALLVAALIALVLGSYLAINLGAARLSLRTYGRNAAFHLAEAGLEEGLWTYNRLLAGHSDAWQDWQLSSDSAWRRFDGFQLSPALSGEVKVYASPLAVSESTQPLLVALATVQSSGDAPVTQMLEVTLRRRSLFTAGLVAREAFFVRGTNSTFDAWDSDPDRNPATPRVPYSTAVRTDTIRIATGADLPAELGLSQARIFGSLTTRTSPVVSSSGSVGAFDARPGSVDSSRVSFDYNDNFPSIAAPAGGTLIGSFGTTLGTAGQDTFWRASALRLSGNDTLTILGRVTLVLTDPVDALSIRGSAALVIPEGSSLTLYLSGDISISGRGLVNSNPAPEALQIWSTAGTARAQSIQLAGRSALSAVVYAPEAQITVNGTPELSGSVIARTITFAGNAAFHYDHALSRFTRHAGYGASGWTAVTDAARKEELQRMVGQ